MFVAIDVVSWQNGTHGRGEQLLFKGCVGSTAGGKGGAVGLGTRLQSVVLSPTHLALPPLHASLKLGLDLNGSDITFTPLIS